MKKKKSRKLDSYAIGTNKHGVVRNYIQSPDEAIMESDRMIAKAKHKAASNGWTQALDIVGNMALQYGASQMGGYGGAMTGAVQGGVGLASMENGGVAGKVPVEIEGEEVVETPNGEVAKAKGPSHEQGGIEVALPEGTKIFSKKLKVGGKSLAQRKLDRENKMKRLMKKLDDNPTDKILKNTIKLQEEKNAQQEEADFQVQEFASALDELTKFAYGTSMKGLQAYSNGTGRRGVKRPPYFTKNFDSGFFDQVIAQNPTGEYPFLNRDWDDIENRKSLQKHLGVTQDGIFGKNTLAALKDKYGTPTAPVDSTPNSAIDYGAIDAAFANPVLGDDASLSGDAGRIPSMATPGFNSGDTVSLSEDELLNAQDGYSDPENAPGRMGSIFSRMFGGGGDNPQGGGGNGMRITGGDALGMAGTLFGSIAPYLQSLKNEADTPIEKNVFEDYGQDALDTNEAQQAYIAQQREQAGKEIRSARETATRRNRNTARGINQIRALDLTADQAANQAIADTYDAYAQQMMALLGQRANMQMDIDKTVMTAEDVKNVRELQNMDNADTQQLIDKLTMAEGMQKMGRDLNVAKGNKDFMDILPDTSQYGIGYTYNQDGQLVLDQANKAPASGPVEELPPGFSRTPDGRFMINGELVDEQEFYSMLDQAKNI